MEDVTITATFTPLYRFRQCLMCGTRHLARIDDLIECRGCGVKFKVAMDADGEETWTLQWSYGG
jgi:hypothetical protein